MLRREWVGWLMCASLLVHCESLDEKHAKRLAEAAKVEAARQRKREQHDRLARQREEAEARARAAEKEEAAAAERLRQQLKTDRIAEYAAMTPAQRETQLREACEGGCTKSRVKEVVDAAPTNAEKRRLQALADRLDAAQAREDAAQAREDERVNEKLRERFASSVDAALLGSRMNPDGVSATGAGKKTLQIRGWFCSRQFIHDVSDEPLGRSAREAGFTKIECRSAASWWSTEL